MGDDYLKSIHWFRGFAILVITAMHSTLYPIEQHYWGKYFIELIANGTTFFIFIAGYLFWHLIDRYHYSKYLIKKAKYVLCPYIILLTITLVGIYVLNVFGIRSIDYSRFDYIVSLSNVLEENGFFWHYFVGGAIIKPFWFIPMIIVYYILTPVFIWLAKGKLIYLTLCLAVVCSLVVERNSFVLNNFFHFLGFWFLGIFCKIKQDTINRNSIQLFLFGFTLSLLVMLFSVDTDIELDVNVVNIQKMFLCITILSFFMFLEKHEINMNFFNVLADYSFGIFFIHYYMVIPCVFLVNYLELQNTIFDFVFCFIVPVLSSILVVKILRFFLKERSKYFVGV